MTDESTATDDLAARIRAARAIANQSQAELASRVGVSRATIGKWERGESPVPSLVAPGLIAEVARATGVSEGFLNGRETD